MCGSCIMQDHILGEAEKYEILTFSALPSYYVWLLMFFFFFISEHHLAVSVTVFRGLFSHASHTLHMAQVPRLGFVVFLSNTLQQGRWNKNMMGGGGRLA